MTREEKREHVLTSYGTDVVSHLSGLTSVKQIDGRRRAALTALAAIDAGKRWRDVLKEFER